MKYSTRSREREYAIFVAQYLYKTHCL